MKDKDCPGQCPQTHVMTCVPSLHEEKRQCLCLLPQKSIPKNKHDFYNVSPNWWSLIFSSISKYEFFYMYKVYLYIMMHDLMDEILKQQ